MPTPPTWLLSWRRLLIAVLTLPLRMLRMWKQMICLQHPKVNSMLRAMLQQTPPGDGEEAQEIRQFEAVTRIQPLDSRTCPHRKDAIKRSGNRNGRFAHCVDCNTKWKWVATTECSMGEIEGWVVWQPQLPLRSQLPTPSPDSILEVIPAALETTSLRTRDKQRVEALHAKKLMDQAAAENCQNMGISPTVTPFPPRTKAMARPVPGEDQDDVEIRSTATATSRNSDRRRISRRDVEMDEIDDLETVYTGWTDSF